MDLKKKKVIVICLLVFLCVGISIWQSTPSITSEGTLQEQGKRAEQDDKVREKTAKREPATICVYISGAVRNPGLHDIPVGSRGMDAIAQAGGFLENANKDKVNLAKKLKDGNHLNVPFLKSTERRRNKGETTEKRKRRKTQRKAGGVR